MCRINFIQFYFSGLNARDVIIRAGTSFHDRNGVQRKVKRIIVHELYDHTDQDYDIALIEIVEPLEFSQSIQSIGLPNTNESIPDNTMCFVSGWGTSHSFLVFMFRRTELRAVEVPIVDQKTCEANYERAGIEITPRMMCAGYEKGGKDSCQGDSGGPLACPSTQQNANTTLFGIVSWGNECAEPYFPGVYSRVPVFREWIHQQSGI